MEKAYVVYKHTNKINGKVYIGITSQKPKHRWQEGKGYRTNRHFWAAINKYGWDNFSHEIIKTGLDLKAAAEQERNLIKQYHAADPAHGYNSSTGGENPGAGVKLSEETKRKIAEQKLGEKNPMYHKPALNRKAVAMLDPETGEVIATFVSAQHAATCMGRASCRTNIARVCRGERNTYKGYKWIYL